MELVKLINLFSLNEENIKKSNYEIIEKYKQKELLSIEGLIKKYITWETKRNKEELLKEVLEYQEKFKSDREKEKEEWNKRINRIETRKKVLEAQIEKCLSSNIYKGLNNQLIIKELKQELIKINEWLSNESKQAKKRH